MRDYWIELLNGRLPNRIFFVDPKTLPAEDAQLAPTTTVMHVQEVVPGSTLITREEFRAAAIKVNPRAEKAYTDLDVLEDELFSLRPNPRDLEPSQRPVFDESDKF